MQSTSLQRLAAIFIFAVFFPFVSEFRVSYLMADAPASPAVHDSSKQKTVRLLTIGSSFTDSGMYLFPQVVASVPGCTLIQNRACIGGSGMEMHCAGIDKSLRDPKFKQYPYGDGYTLKELLELDKWDVVLLQPHFSRMSYNVEVEIPSFERIVDYVKKYAKQAEIAIQMPWSFHPSHPLIHNGQGKFKDSDAMYESLKKNYALLAQKFNLRIIPTGLAVQYARHWREKTDEPTVDLKNYTYPNRPAPSPNYYISMAYWLKDAEGKMQIRQDCVHLDKRGQYIQSCVWFAMLFGKKVSEVTYVPGDIPAKEAEFYRKAAQKAVDDYVQPRQR